MSARHLPAAWSSTANSLAETSFLAADALLVIDDFCPTGSPNDVQKWHSIADTVIRGGANGQGRGRLTREGKPRALRRPRALVVSTGEEQVRGVSLRARTLPIHMEAGQVDWHTLGTSQSDAARGLLAESLAGYIRWLADRMDEVRAARTPRINELRDLCAAGPHKRTPAANASFLFGWEMFLGYAEDTNAITAEEAEALWERGWDAMEQAAAEASAGVSEADPAARFLTLLSAAIGGGGAHVAGINGGCPSESHQAWGWRGGESNAVPMGHRVGWIHGDDLYLNSEIAYIAARSAGEGLVMDIDALRQRLREAGLLASVDETRTPTLLTIRKRLEKVQRRVLHLRSDALEDLSHLGDSQVTQGASARVTLSHPRVTWVTHEKWVSDQVKQSVIVGESPKSPKQQQITRLTETTSHMGGMSDTRGLTEPKTPAVSSSATTRSVSGDSGDSPVLGDAGTPPPYVSG